MSSLLMTDFATSTAFDGLFNTASCANAACIPATNTATTTANRHIVILLRLRCHPRQGPLDRPGRRLHEHPPVPVAHPRQQEVAPKPRRHDRGLPPGQPKWEQTSAQAHERQEALPPRAGLPVAHRVGEHHQHHAQREPPPREHTEQDDPDEGGRDEPPPRLARPATSPPRPAGRREGCAIPSLPPQRPQTAPDEDGRDEPRPSHAQGNQKFGEGVRPGHHSSPNFLWYVPGGRFLSSTASSCPHRQDQTHRKLDKAPPFRKHSIG